MAHSSHGVVVKARGCSANKTGTWEGCTGRRKQATLNPQCPLARSSPCSKFPSLGGDGKRSWRVAWNPWDRVLAGSPDRPIRSDILRTPLKLRSQHEVLEAGGGDLEHIGIVLESRQCQHTKFLSSDMKCSRLLHIVQLSLKRCDVAVSMTKKHVSRSPVLACIFDVCLHRC